MQDVLIGLAKAAILVALNQPENFDLESALKKYPELLENGAAFVTINKRPNDQLRGCIGSLQAYRPLYKDIISNAQSAALRDPRFKALTAEEFKHVKVEVSILSEPKRLDYSDEADLRSKIKPFEDGVVLKLGERQSTYLPQVWEQLPNFDDFFSTLCQKANLTADCLSEHPEVLTYQVKKYKEK
jgi:AmmeMemoRadiSam system protein A